MTTLTKTQERKLNKKNKDNQIQHIKANIEFDGNFYHVMVNTVSINKFCTYDQAKKFILQVGYTLIIKATIEFDGNLYHVMVQTVSINRFRTYAQAERFIHEVGYTLS